MLLCVPKIGGKLLLGKKPTPKVKVMSQEDGQKLHKSKIWLFGHDNQGVPWPMGVLILIPDFNVNYCRL